MKSRLSKVSSKESMKKARKTIDFASDKMTMLGETLDLKFTQSGHYAVPIFATEEDLIISEVEVLFNENSKATEDQKKVARKLHQQFAHPKSKKIIQLIKDVEKKMKNYLKVLQISKMSVKFARGTESLNCDQQSDSHWLKSLMRQYQWI